jgi:hypothetical protein
MLVRPDERVPLARLLQFLEHGERLAHDCARAQASLAPDAGARRFLAGQARQEALHAAVFHGAVAWLAPRRLGACPVLPPLERYRALIEEAIRERRFAETLLAQQIILEGLGEAILKRLEAGLVKRKAGFGRLRRTLLHQEEAHHAFGLRALEKAIQAGQTSPEALRDRAQEYLSAADAMVMALGDLFASIDEDTGAYIKDAKAALPQWLSP